MITCEICGKEFENRRFYEPYDKVCGSDCFSEKLWRMRSEDYKNGKVKYIIVKGEAYIDGGHRENARDKSFLGHGGHLFHIRMNDGEYIITNNLWRGGAIPDKYIDVMADNAVFE